MGEVWGWDASHYDAVPTQRDGIDLYTHKIAEGHHFYQDMEYGPAINAARDLGIPYLGSYFVNHGGTVQDQVDWWFQLLEKYSPWWKDHPWWTFQIDAEKFRYMSRAPSIDEINAMGDLIYNRSGLPAGRILNYAPRWLYGTSIRRLKYPNYWASNYGGNPVAPYRAVYPGDSSTRWQPEDFVLQYGSRTIIAGQTTCDANAIRGTRADFEAQLMLKEGTVTLMLCKYGDKGPVVETMQRLILEAGGTLPRFGPDGDYGDETATALKALFDGDGKTYGPMQYVALHAEAFGGIGIGSTLTISGTVTAAT